MTELMDQSSGWTEEKHNAKYGHLEYFTYDELIIIEKVFDMLDTDGDGVLCLRDLMNSMKLVQIEKSKEEIISMIQESDYTHSGTIEYSEFIYIYREYFQPFINENEFESTSSIRWSEKNSNTRIGKSMRKSIYGRSKHSSSAIPPDSYLSGDIYLNGDSNANGISNLNERSKLNPGTIKNKTMISNVNKSRNNFTKSTPLNDANPAFTTNTVQSRITKRIMPAQSEIVQTIIPGNAQSFVAIAKTKKHIQIAEPDSVNYNFKAAPNTTFKADDKSTFKADDKSTFKADAKSTFKPGAKSIFKHDDRAPMAISRFDGKSNMTRSRYDGRANMRSRVEKGRNIAQSRYSMAESKYQDELGAAESRYTKAQSKYKEDLNNAHASYSKFQKERKGMAPFRIASKPNSCKYSLFDPVKMSRSHVS